MSRRSKHEQEFDAYQAEINELAALIRITAKDLVGPIERRIIELNKLQYKLGAWVYGNFA